MSKAEVTNDGRPIFTIPGDSGLWVDCPDSYGFIEDIASTGAPRRMRRDSLERLVEQQRLERAKRSQDADRARAAQEEFLAQPPVDLCRGNPACPCPETYRQWRHSQADRSMLVSPSGLARYRKNTVQEWHDDEVGEARKADEARLEQQRERRRLLAELHAELTSKAGE